MARAYDLPQGRLHGLERLVDRGRSHGPRRMRFARLKQAYVFQVPWISCAGPCAPIWLFSLAILGNQRRSVNDAVEAMRPTIGLTAALDASFATGLSGGKTKARLAAH